MPSGRFLAMTICVVLILLLSTVPGLASDSCISCHLELGGSLGKPSEVFENDIHQQVGLSCASCHGGTPSKNEMEETKGPGTGFIGTPAFQVSHNACPV